MRLFPAFVAAASRRRRALSGTTAGCGSALSGSSSAGIISAASASVVSSLTGSSAASASGRTAAVAGSCPLTAGLVCAGTAALLPGAAFCSAAFLSAAAGSRVLLLRGRLGLSLRGLLLGSCRFARRLGSGLGNRCRCFSLRSRRRYRYLGSLGLPGRCFRCFRCCSRCCCSFLSRRCLSGCCRLSLCLFDIIGFPGLLHRLMEIHFHLSLTDRGFDQFMDRGCLRTAASRAALAPAAVPVLACGALSLAIIALPGASAARAAARRASCFAAACPAAAESARAAGIIRA